jgi:hypothetical protein
MMTIATKINRQEDNTRKFGIKMIPIGKTELQRIMKVKDGVKMVLVMELTRETELLATMLTVMDLKTGLSMEHIILMKKTELTEILKNVIEMKHHIKTKLNMTATRMATKTVM